jgi:sporulation protein YlmC with PRC-barrel domain
MTSRKNSELRGIKVVGASGRIFGMIDDILIDTETWRVTHLVIQVSSDAVTDLGLEKPFWSHAMLEIPIHQVAGASDAVILRSTVAEYAAMIASAKSAPT